MRLMVRTMRNKYHDDAAAADDEYDCTLNSHDCVSNANL